MDTAGEIKQSGDYRVCDCAGQKNTKKAVKNLPSVTNFASNFVVSAERFVERSLQCKKNAKQSR